MSDDEVDLELLELLRQSLGIGGPKTDEVSKDTGVLKDAEYIYNNSCDVSIDMVGTKGAAASTYKLMQQRSYSTQTWGEHELHPTQSKGFSDIDIVNFVFTMDLLNFSFWSDLPEANRYQVEYRGRRWTGYNSLVASLRRAIDEGVPITTPRFWNDPKCSDETLEQVFRSATQENIPLFDDRLTILREAGQILTERYGEPEFEEDELVTILPTDACDHVAPHHPDNAELETTRVDVEVENTDAPPIPEPVPDAADIPQISPQGRAAESEGRARPDLSVIRLIEEADHSAGKLVNLLAKHFPSFRDETRFDGRKVRILKRAQIFVADVWAALNGAGHGTFDDIGHLTMFADYRVPQMLRSLGVLVFSPPLEHTINGLKQIPSGHSWEVQLRGCSIWAVELIRREILRQHPGATNVNAVLIDFFLYDLAKEREASGAGGPAAHRTRSIWY